MRFAVELPNIFLDVDVINHATGIHNCDWLTDMLEYTANCCYNPHTQFDMWRCCGFADSQ